MSRAVDPDTQKIWHAALKLGDSIFFVNDTFARGHVTQSQTSLWLYVADVDASFKRAVAAGAKATMQPADMFWGDRMGQVTDDFGQKWTIATHIKDLSEAEMKVAQAAFHESMKNTECTGQTAAK